MPSIRLYHITPDESLPLENQAFSLDELTRQLPQGLYTTFRTFDEGKRALGLSAHLQRLYQPAALQGIKPTASSATLRDELAKVLQAFPGEARVRLILTGSGEVYIALTALITLHQEVYQSGAKVITTNVKRESPRLKSTSFIEGSESLRTQIAGSEIFEALLARNGLILEGMTSNFFYIKNGVLGTARKNILLGVTRRTVLRVGRGMGLDIIYRPLLREQVQALDEAFLTSSSRGIVPIIQIDQTKVGRGSPGDVTKNLMNKYNAYISGHAEVI